LEINLNRIIFSIISLVLALCVLQYIKIGEVEVVSGWMTVEVQSKFRTGRGGDYITFNGEDYSLSAGGFDSEVFYQKVEQGEAIEVVVTNSNQIAALRYKGKYIYTENEFLQGIESSRSLFGFIVIFLIILWFLIIFLTKGRF